MLEKCTWPTPKFESENWKAFVNNYTERLERTSESYIERLNETFEKNNETPGVKSA